jgi:hypothetical protein
VIAFKVVGLGQPIGVQVLASGNLHVDAHCAAIPLHPGWYITIATPLVRRIRTVREKSIVVAQPIDAHH